MNPAYEKIKSVNEELTLFLFKEDALIYSERTHQVHWLNAVGIFIWLNLEEGLDQQTIKNKCLANSYNNNDKQKLDLLIEELNSLFKTSILKKQNNIDLSHEQGMHQDQSDQEDIWLNEIHFSQKNNKTNISHKILDLNFNFSFPNKEIEKLIMPILKPFALSALNKNYKNKQPEKIINFQIVSENKDNYRMIVNDFTFSWKIPPQRLLSFFLDRVRKIALAYSNYFLAAHAAVLSKGENCFLMPAVSYSGKSTLSAALFAKGYQYLSDEMAVLDEHFNARPVPLGLGLKSGSWKILENYLPQLATATELERWDGVAIKYLPMAYQAEQNISASELSATVKKVSHLIFPHYQANAQAQLTPLSIPQAIYKLYQAGYTQGKALTLHALEQILNGLSNIPAYSFEFDELEEASHSLEGLSLEGFSLEGLNLANVSVAAK